MSHEQRLGFGEFLSDIRLVIASPGHRFSVIRERGASWGSMLLLLVPAYLGFNFVGGLYFPTDPFPGYSFFPPLFFAIAAVYLKLFAIHISARLFQGRKSATPKPGSFTDLKVVFGYTGVPALLAILLATVLFLFIPQEIGHVMRDLKVVGVSILVALAIALFIWNLILVVLALRTVYDIRDIKIVAAFILGSALMWIPGALTYWVVAQPRVDLEYVQPVFSSRILRFIATDPTSNTSANTKFSVHVDKLAYSLRQPQRSEIVAYAIARKPAGNDSAIVVGGQPSLFLEDRNFALGRIIGIPGDTVEFVKGSLRINGQPWREPYITADYWDPITIPATHLGTDEYLILPDNRHLVEKQLQNDLVVSRSRILGREILSRWPLGWWFYRPSLFLESFPEN